MPFGAPSVVALAWVCSFFAPDAATSPPPSTASPTLMATIRATEGGSESASALLVGLDRTKRLSWDRGLSYVGVALDEVVATFRIDGAPGSRLASLAVLEKLAAVNPGLLRPPIVVLSARGVEYRGVVESLSYQCGADHCDVKVAVLQGDTATSRGPEEGWEWGPRN